MGNRHIIEEAVFDISFGSTRDAREQEPGLGSFIQDRLLPLAEEIFDEISADGMEARLDMLEIDLGDISYSGFMEEMESRFREQLKAALLEKIQSVKTTQSKNEGIFSKIQAERGRLESYLETGRITWNSDHLTRQTTEEILQRAIREDGAKLIEFLKNTPHRESVVKRLSRQFSEDSLAEIVRLLSPGQTNVWGDWAGTTWKSWERNFKGVTENEFRSSTWELLIHEHLKSGSGVPDKKRIFGEIMRLIFLQYATTQNSHDLRKLRERERGAAPISKTKPDIENTLQERELLRRHLESALLQGLAGNLNGKWDHLKQKHPDLILESFQRWMGEEGARAKVAESFSEAMLLDIARILAPAEIGLIEALADTLRNQPKGTANAKNITLWKHTLKHLHDSEGFDRRAYAQNLIQQLSGQDQKAALKTLRVFVPDLGADLAAKLLATQSPTEVEVRTLTALETRKRIEAHILQNHGDLENDFWREIEAHARKARDEQRYYQRVLENLLHDRIVDLEAAMGAEQETHRETESLREMQTPAHLQIDTPLQERELLRRHLESALMQGFLGNLNGKWDHLKQKHPDLILESFQRWMGEEGARAKVAESFSEAMLLDIARILAPAQIGLIEALTDTLRNQPKGTANAKNITLWKHTLKHLHDSERFDRRAYAQSLIQQLSGQDQKAALKTLRAFVPDLGEDLAAKLVATQNPTEVEVKTLTAQQARKRIEAHILQNHGDLENDFWREIEAHARKARDEQRYYQRVLENLLHDRIVDLEEAMAGEHETSRAQEAGQDSPATKTPLHERELLRRHLESALLQGFLGNLDGKWDELKHKHPDLVRESFQRRMGEESARAKVAQNFPEAMLLDIARILAPEEIGLIEALADTLRNPPKGTANARNITLWKHTLKHLYDSERFDRRAYARSLMQQLAGQSMAQAAALKTLSATHPQLAAELVAHQQHRKPPQAEENRHSSVDPREMGPVQKTGRQANGHTESGDQQSRNYPISETGADIKMLSTQEARNRIKVHFIRVHGTLENDFWREIEAHAKKAQDVQRYYQRVLDSLLNDRVVDLEEAMGTPHEAGASNDYDAGVAGQARRETETGDGEFHRQEREGQPWVRREADSSPARPVPARPSFSLENSKREEEIAGGEEIYISNAGMVLLSPYMPQLFRMLELTDGQKFTGEKAAERAVHLLQFSVNESCDTPEFQLVLNKLLSGIATGVPVTGGIEIRDMEKETIEGMLQAIIQRWTIIGNTSVHGLRESFLQRGGRLQFREDRWHLKVEFRGIDVLLDRLPWSFSVIRHPWMTQPIHVEWR